MTEEEAIAVLEWQFVSDAGFLARLSNGERLDRDNYARAIDALDFLKEYWRDHILVPKRAVLPMMYVDRFLSSAGPALCTDDEVYAVFDLRTRIEDSLITSYSGADEAKLISQAIGTGHHRAYLPNLGLTDEVLSTAYDLCLGEDNVLFDGLPVRFLEQWRVAYALDTFEKLVQTHRSDRMTPGALAVLMVGLYGHLVDWRRPEPGHQQKQLDLAGQLWKHCMRYLGEP